MTERKAYNGADNPELPEIKFEVDDSWQADPVDADPIPDSIPDTFTPAELSKIFPSGTAWAYVNGVYSHSNHVADAVYQAADRSGLDDMEANRLTNLVGRNIKPTTPDVAFGILHQGRPIIWHSTINRNTVMDGLVPYLNEAARHRLYERESTDDPALQNVSIPEPPSRPRAKVPQQAFGSKQASDLDLYRGHTDANGMPLSDGDTVLYQGKPHRVTGFWGDGVGVYISVNGRDTMVRSTDLVVQPKGSDTEGDIRGLVTNASWTKVAERTWDTGETQLMIANERGWARIALELAEVGDQDAFESWVREEVLPELSHVDPSKVDVGSIFQKFVNDVREEQEYAEREAVERPKREAEWWSKVDGDPDADPRQWQAGDMLEDSRGSRSMVEAPLSDPDGYLKMRHVAPGQKYDAKSYSLHPRALVDTYGYRRVPAESAPEAVPERWERERTDFDTPEQQRDLIMNASWQKEANDGTEWVWNAMNSTPNRTRLVKLLVEENEDRDDLVRELRNLAQEFMQNDAGTPDYVWTTTNWYDIAKYAEKLEDEGDLDTAPITISHAKQADFGIGEDGRPFYEDNLSAPEDLTDLFRKWAEKRLGAGLDYLSDEIASSEWQIIDDHTLESVQISYHLNDDGSITETEDHMIPPDDPNSEEEADYFGEATNTFTRDEWVPQVDPEFSARQDAPDERLKAPYDPAAWKKVKDTPEQREDLVRNASVMGQDPMMIDIEGPQRERIFEPLENPVPEIIPMPEPEPQEEPQEPEFEPEEEPYEPDEEPERAPEEDPDRELVPAGRRSSWKRTAGEDDADNEVGFVPGVQLGTRVLFIRQNGKGIEVYSGSASGYGYVWTPGEAVEATCNHSSHDAPAPDCTCGIYAVTDNNMDEMASYASQRPFVVVQLSLWGRVFSGRGVNDNSEVYRAEKAYPKKFIVPDGMRYFGKYNSEDIAKMLKRMYGVDAVANSDEVPFKYRNPSGMRRDRGQQAMISINDFDVFFQNDEGFVAEAQTMDTQDETLYEADVTLSTQGTYGRDHEVAFVFNKDQQVQAVIEWDGGETIYAIQPPGGCDLERQLNESDFDSSVPAVIKGWAEDMGGLKWDEGCRQGMDENYPYDEEYEYLEGEHIQIGDVEDLVDNCIKMSRGYFSEEEQPVESYQDKHTEGPDDDFGIAMSLIKLEYYERDDIQVDPHDMVKFLAEGIEQILDGSFPYDAWEAGNAIHDGFEHVDIGNGTGSGISAWNLPYGWSLNMATAQVRHLIPADHPNAVDATDFLAAIDGKEGQYVDPNQGQIFNDRPVDPADFGQPSGERRKDYWNKTPWQPMPSEWQKDPFYGRAS